MQKPFVLACVLALVLAGCAKSSDTTTTSASGASPAGTAAGAGGTKTIGVSIQNREAQFYQDMER
ncbi:MAG: hypothetical protein JO225_07905, partial [Candidatus Eremiobacteraeota bacterium]|nr:hypothetical protein [Candidatus Eremiobacteraeota bacterium]